MHEQTGHDQLVGQILDHSLNRDRSRRDLRKIKDRLEALGIRELEAKLSELNGEPDTKMDH